MTDNVIAFPKGKKGSPPQSIDETVKMVEENRKQHVENILENMIPHFVNCLNEEGIDCTHERMVLPLSYFVEVVRGLFYCNMRLDHHSIQTALEFYKNESNDN